MLPKKKKKPYKLQVLPFDLHSSIFGTRWLNCFYIKLISTLEFSQVYFSKPTPLQLSCLWPEVSYTGVTMKKIIQFQSDLFSFILME